jgi:hypothetical protein
MGIKRIIATGISRCEAGTCLLAGCLLFGLPAHAANAPAVKPSGKYQFDGTISRQVLENFLRRSISVEGVFNGRGDLDDNLRMLKKLGYLQMPGSRTCTSPDLHWYFANNPGPACPAGMGDEEAIRAVWAADEAKSGKNAPGTAPGGGWVNVTGNVGGEEWGAYGVTYMTAVPGSEEVIAGVSERGLWASGNRGTTWRKLGGNENEMKFRPGRIVFDPQDPSTFWVSGCYGDAPFKTQDGGKTFQRLGKLAHADGVAVDFTDPGRKTLLLGLHEQSQSLQLSSDGGNAWTRIGAKLPADSNHSSDPIIIDSRTFLINTAGWKANATLGIYRSEDAGQSWKRVSLYGPQGPALVASDGAIYWQRVWGGGLLKSTDQGRTWKQVSSAVKDNPIELPNKRLGGLAGAQIMVSADGGAKWTKLGPPAPFKPNGIIYSDKGKCFYAWRLSDNMKMEKQSIVRLTTP